MAIVILHSIISIVSVLLIDFGVEGYGSCREANLCCTGRDGSCMVQSFEVAIANSVNSNVQSDHPRNKPCYCDHACLRLGDCCYDFQEVCGVRDCKVSAWGSWSDCSAQCGFGAMTRERHVTEQAVNGGAHCPELLQKRSCYGSQCEKHSHSKANREIAMILPATYSVIRQLNASQDIRSNLRLRYRKDPEQEKSKEYCVIFEVTKTKKACENLGNEVSSKIVKGSTVCVSCEAAAMRKHLGYRCQGHGVEHKSTRFAFLSFPQCHGRWKKKEMVEKCNCDEEGKANFIFV